VGIHLPLAACGGLLVTACGRGDALGSFGAAVYEITFTQRKS
jgi:hypothetical protein